MLSIQYLFYYPANLYNLQHIASSQNLDTEFMDKNKSILEHTRGGGYWLWKPYIINKTLDKLNDGDILFYMDSMYYFIENFTHYILNLLSKQDILVWKNKPNEITYLLENWCKMDVVNKYSLYEPMFKKQMHIGLCWAGAIVIRKTTDTCKYMAEWLDMCCCAHDITDSPSVAKNNTRFREHRHDQSLLSIILYKYKIPMHILENRYLQNVRCPFKNS
jgi:hypothetical protein